MTSRYYAVQALKKHGITRLPITLEKVEEILETSGWKIVNYDLENEKHIEILEKYDSLSEAEASDAFAYKKDDVRIIFIRIGFSTNERRILLAHELGHIEMNHLVDNSKAQYHPFGLIDAEQEDEANNFAIEFLAPVCILDRQQIRSAEAIESVTLLDSKRSQIVADKIRRHEAFSTYEKELCSSFEKIKPKASFPLKHAISIFIIIFLVATARFPNANMQPESTDQPYHTPEPQQIVKTVDTTSDTAIITQHGERYHLPDCRHIRNSTAATSVSISDAQALGYTPCADCRPE